MRLLGKMLQSLLAYPDGCRHEEVVTLERGGIEEVVASAPAVAQDLLRPGLDPVVHGGIGDRPVARALHTLRWRFDTVRLPVVRPLDAERVYDVPARGRDPPREVADFVPDGALFRDRAAAMSAISWCDDVCGVYLGKSRLPQAMIAPVGDLENP